MIKINKMNSKNFTTKDSNDYIDLLDEDQSISGQKYCCISFISPEKILKKKELYFFDEFIKQYEFSKSIIKFNQFLNFISFKYDIDNSLLNEDMKEFLKEEENNLDFTVYDDFKSYKDQNEEKLEEKFLKDNNFITNTRGVKIRGCFPSQEEAEFRCKILRQLDPYHDVYVGPVGVWMP